MHVRVNHLLLHTCVGINMGKWAANTSGAEGEARKFQALYCTVNKMSVCLFL